MKRGKKPILTDIQKMMVGAECQSVIEKLSLEEADARMEAAKYINTIRATQREAREGSRRFKFPLVRGGEKIDAALEAAKASRFSSVSIRRPYRAADDVLRAGVSFCWRKYRKRITTTYARDCLDFFRATEAALTRALD